MTSTTTRGLSSGGRPTLRQVAAAAGVSRATASRVVNGGHLVSPQAKAAVEAAIDELGFTPHPVARSLARRRTGSVALVVPEPNARILSDPYFATTINGLARELEDSDLQMILLIDRRSGTTDRMSRYLASGHVDGAVIASHHRGDPLNTTVPASGLPVVFIGRPLDVPPGTRYVDVDNHHGARIAVHHLIATGRRRIGTVAGPPDMSAAIDRLEGWRAALAEAELGGGKLRDDAMVHGDFTMEGGRLAAAELLEAHPDLDAIFVASDLMAVGVLRELQARGLRVPSDIAVVGFDDIGVAEHTEPPLTTIVQPVEEMAARAGALLQQLLEEPDSVSTEPVIYEPRLVVRASA